MKNNPESLEINRTTIKLLEPASGRIERVGLLIHGFTGDESSMWVFTNQLTDHWLLIAPRAPYPSKGADLGGYSWVNQSVQSWPVFQDFLPSVAVLDGLLDGLAEHYQEADFNRIYVAGFSQGAAMSAVYAAAQPKRVVRLAMLSGFLRRDWPHTESG